MQCTVLTCLKRPNIFLPSVILTTTVNYLIYSNFVFRVAKTDLHFIFPKGYLLAS